MNRELIHFTANLEGTFLNLETYRWEYRNLMLLLTDKMYIENFGACKGMGRCGTCLIKISDLPLALSTFERNEERTLHKAGILEKNLRLACQILVNEHLQNIQVEIVGGEAVG